MKINLFYNFSKKIFSKKIKQWSILGSTVVTVGGIVAYSTVVLPQSVYAVQVSKEPMSFSKYMAPPITKEEVLVKNSDDTKTKMEHLVLRIQSEFCKALEAEETSGKTFYVDSWRRKEEGSGGGITCVLQDGEVFEKAGVNVTVMRAPLSKKLQESMRARGKHLPEDESFTFFAAGVSSVIHPRSPHVPTIHFNYRYFEVMDEKGNKRDWWFGGGTDLTPYYLEEDDVKLFHGQLKSACDVLDPETYQKYKKWCDDYFVIQFRGERRGVGGIFFDDLTSDDSNSILPFVTACADAVIPSYLPLVQKSKTKAVSEGERDWQLLRRGRYVEFNLVYDRGTKFGFATPGARIESILMSLPLVAGWKYMHKPEEDSPEGKLMEVLKNPRDWL